LTRAANIYDPPLERRVITGYPTHSSGFELAPAALEVERSDRGVLGMGAQAHIRAAAWTN